MSERPPGFEEYTPSRLEWLVVMLNSYVHYINTMSGECAEYLYTLGDDGKTIILRVRHYADLNPEAVKKFAENAKEFAMDIAETYKWDSWINIQTEFTPIDRPTTKEQD